MPLSTTEILIIAVGVIVVFGSTAIPKFARALRQARRELTAPE